ncbi:MAG: glycosyltransferase family 2 protein [Candidatus Helarchaeota archaeon]
MGPLVSILIITRNRKDDLLDTISNIQLQDYDNIEIIVVENGSNEETIKSNYSVLSRYNNIKYVILKKNLGVSGGRNVALRLAKGDYIIEIDDDAIFRYKNSISLSVGFLERNKNVGILAFKIVNFYTNKISRNEFPFKRKKRNHTVKGPCTWFIGAGHIITRDCLSKVGFYKDFFPWGHEEQDYSIRCLDEGFEIYYFPEVEVLHKKTQKGRLEDSTEFIAIKLKNRIKVAILSLPMFSIISYYFFWSLYFVVKEKDILLPFIALKNIYKEKEYLLKNRKRIKLKTVLRLFKLNGQLFY